MNSPWLHAGLFVLFIALTYAVLTWVMGR